MAAQPGCQFNRKISLPILNAEKVEHKRVRRQERKMTFRFLRAAFLTTKPPVHRSPYFLRTKIHGQQTMKSSGPFRGRGTRILWLVKSLVASRITVAVDIFRED